VRSLRVYWQRDAETPGRSEGWNDALLERDGHPFVKPDPDLDLAS
jgi:hypothetical protein